MNGAAELLRGDLEWETREYGSEYERWADEDGARIEYPIWHPDTSRVVSGPYGPVWYSRFPGKRFPSRTLARQYWCTRARVIEEYRVPGRYMFRIRR